MRLRDFTQDFLAFQEVYCENEYRLPERFAGDDVILDIGAHVGTFALACLSRGANRVVCYEPDPANFEVLLDNVLDYPAVEAHRLAVWRSDRAEPVRVRRFPHPHMTACSQVAPESAGMSGDAAASVALDEVLRGLGRVRLMKLDCEGSEYPILYTARELHRCDEVVGEAHEKMPFPGCPWPLGGAGVAAFLEARGFDCECVPNPRAPEVLSWFFARRRGGSS